MTAKYRIHLDDVPYDCIFNDDGQLELLFIGEHMVVEHVSLSTIEWLENEWFEINEFHK